MVEQAEKDDQRILSKRGYTLGKKLGEGAYAKVFLCTYTDPNTGAEVKLACKVIDGKKASKTFMTKFFPREIEVMRKINHPNLIRIHSLIQRKAEKRFFIFMQFAERGDVLDFIRSNGALKEHQARVWYSQMIQAIGYLHGKHMCHRDLKCENLLLSSSLNIKVSDFGFARVWKKGEARSESYCGSMSYSPPEIIRGVPYEPLKADLWTMGVILYVMVNKSLPFSDTSHKQMYEEQVARNWKMRPKAAAKCSNEIKSFIYLLLEPEPNKRMTTGKMWKHEWIQSAPMMERAALHKK